MRRFSWLLLLMLPACGDGSSTEPGEDPLAGTWAYDAPTLSGMFAGAPLVCSMTGVRLTFTEAKSGYIGTFRDGTLDCGFGQTSGLAGQIINISRRGSVVAFDLANPSWSNSGNLAGERINGTAIVQVTSETQAGTLTGNLAAEKRPDLQSGP